MADEGTISVDRGAGFENDHHRAEIVSYLRDGYVPLKFAFAGSATHTHDQLAKSGEYQSTTSLIDDEAAFIGENFPGRFQLCEIGPGNGTHTAELLRSLSVMNFAPSAYLAIDFSRNLLDLMIDRLDMPSDIPITTEVWDIESGPATHVEQWRDPAGPVLLWLLGLTIGNLEDPRFALRNIRDSIREGDTIIVSAAMHNPWFSDEDLLSPYKTEVFTAAALEPLRALGADRESVDLELALEHHHVVGYARILRDITLQGVQLLREQRIRCFLSRRFTSEDLNNALSLAGWRPTGLMSSAEQSNQMLIVATAV